jgi:hypothetical protein
VKAAVEEADTGPRSRKVHDGNLLQYHSVDVGQVHDPVPELGAEHVSPKPHGALGEVKQRPRVEARDACRAQNQEGEKHRSNRSRRFPGIFPLNAVGRCRKQNEGNEAEQHPSPAGASEQQSPFVELS